MTFMLFILWVFSCLHGAEGGPKAWQYPCGQEERIAPNSPVFSFDSHLIIKDLHHHATFARNKIKSILDNYEKKYLGPDFISDVNNEFKRLLNPNETCIYWEPLRGDFLFKDNTSMWKAYAAIAKNLHYIDFTSMLVSEGAVFKKGCDNRYDDNCVFKCESDYQNGCRYSLPQDLQQVLCNMKSLSNESAIPNITEKHIKISTRCIRAYVLNATRGHRKCLRLAEKGVPEIKNKPHGKKENSAMSNFSTVLPSTSEASSDGLSNTSDSYRDSNSMQSHNGTHLRTKRDLLRLKRAHRWGSRITPKPTYQPHKETEATPADFDTVTPTLVRNQNSQDRRSNKQRKHRKRRCRKICRKGTQSKVERQKKRYKKCHCKRYQGRDAHSKACKSMLDNFAERDSHFSDYFILRNVQYTLEKIIVATDTEPSVAALKSRATSVGLKGKPTISLLSTSTVVVALHHFLDYLSSYFR